jgi:hypothetical protein
MAYRVEPGERARAKLGGFPRRAFDALIQTLAEVADNPYDPLRTYPTKDPQVRWVIFGEWGFVEYHVDDAAAIVTLTDVTWTG